jgi:outer membrane protein assembly factor BamD
VASALVLAACGGGSPTVAPAPNDPTPDARAMMVDSLWRGAEKAFRKGQWETVLVHLERANLEMVPNDPRRVRLHFLTGEAMFAQGSQLQAAREFRKVSDETPSDPLAPEALLRAADAFAELWRRPQLDPTYGQTALATYQEVQNRFPSTPAARKAAKRVAELQDRFAQKEYEAGKYYLRLKAYDSAILYFRDVVATYPRSTVAPRALVDLVKAYYKLGYIEDVQETCGYIRRFHANAPGVAEVCPSVAAQQGAS